MVPDGSLPVFSVDQESEAKLLRAMTCKMDTPGVYYAPELADAQTIENLLAFGDRVATAHDGLVARGSCRCRPVPSRERR